MRFVCRNESWCRRKHKTTLFIHNTDCNWTSLEKSISTSNFVGNMTVNRKIKRYNSTQYGTIDCVMLETRKKLHGSVRPR